MRKIRVPSRIPCNAPRTRIPRLPTLKNAIRKSPQDPAIHVEIAKLYFQLEDVSSAERAARAACVLNGDEAHYLNVLLDVLLVRRKFNDIMI
jgi:cytochrome c-type biogenesis protein CcmH/NrfG